VRVSPQRISLCAPGVVPLTNIKLSMAPGLADGPPLLQPCDREDVLGRVLAAMTPRAALLLPGDAPEPSMGDRLERFRRLAAQLHPDRCADSRAAAAFVRVSTAFDAFCVADSLQECGEPHFSDGFSDATAQHCKSHWWLVVGADELDRVLTYRAEATEALRTGLTIQRPGVVAGVDEAALRRLQQRVTDAERVCEQLDRRSGFPRSRLWPPPSPPRCKAAWPLRCAIARLVDVLAHLRTVHRFCLFRGRAFDHSAELEAASPAAVVVDAVMGTLTVPNESAEPRECDVGGDANDADPLDVYMESLEAQLCGRQIPAPSPEKRARKTPFAEREKTAGATTMAPDTCKSSVATPPLGTHVSFSLRGTGISSGATSRDRQYPHQPTDGPASDKGTLGVLRWCSTLRVAAVNGDAYMDAGMRLATGGVVALPASAGGAGTSQTDLQDQLLGELESDGSELADEDAEGHDRS